jgi:hypothetical protein
MNEGRPGDRSLCVMNWACRLFLAKMMVFPRRSPLASLMPWVVNSAGQILASNLTSALLKLLR